MKVDINFDEDSIELIKRMCDQLDGFYRDFGPWLSGFEQPRIDEVLDHVMQQRAIRQHCEMNDARLVSRPLLIELLESHGYEAVSDDGVGMLIKQVDGVGPWAAVYSDIDDERRRQDEKWGGAEHDDLHSPQDWVRFITDHNRWAGQCLDPDTPDGRRAFRRQLIRVAALAVAAIESGDRLMREEG